MRDPGKVMQSHIDMKSESSVGVLSAMRTCEGCRKRKSIAQFTRSPAKCLQCVRRTPRVPS